jgi:hypothetical protein
VLKRATKAKTGSERANRKTSMGLDTEVPKNKIRNEQKKSGIKEKSRMTEENIPKIKNITARNL